MLLQDEMNKYLYYCEFQKELDAKTIRAYRTDLSQFAIFMESYEDIGKEAINAFLLHIHSRYKQKTVKRKIASIKALFNYLEEENNARYSWTQYTGCFLVRQKRLCPYITA